MARLAANADPGLPDITIDDDWTRLELEIALRELRDGAPPLQVFRDLTGDARKWLVTHLSRRGWDIVAGVPVKRAGAGDPEFALDGSATWWRIAPIWRERRAVQPHHRRRNDARQRVGAAMVTDPKPTWCE